MYFLTTYVPYDPAVLQNFWNSIMKTIGASASLGFLIFTVIFVISIFHVVLRFFR